MNGVRMNQGKCESDSQETKSDGGTLKTKSTTADKTVDKLYSADLDNLSDRKLDQLSENELRALLREALEDREQKADQIEQLEQKLDKKNSHLYDLEGALAELQGVVAANADGDLTRRADIDSDADAAVEFVSRYNRMLDEWNETLKQVIEASTTVDQSTNTVAAELETIQTESTQVNDSVTEIANGTDRQSEDLRQINEEMQSISASIEEVAATASSVAEMANTSVTQGDTAQRAATEAISNLEEMEAQTDRMVQTVEHLSELMNDIEEITEFITDVADQTNILALNANIEAARAGEEGDGFAVVAEEVKSLATDTKNATKEISETVTEVREQTGETVDDMHQTRTVVSQTSDAVEAAIESLENVVASVEDVNTSLAEIDTAVDEQAHITQEVVSMVEDVSRVSEVTATSADTVAESIQTQTEAIGEISEEVNAISDQTTELETTAADFVVGERHRRRASRNDTVIDFWHAMGGSKALLLDDFIREFEEEYGDVYFKMKSLGSYDGVLDETMAAAGTEEMPALAQINEIGSRQARTSEAFTPAEFILPRMTQQQLVESVSEYYTVEDTLYSVPFNSSNPILCLNRDLFTAAGLDPDDPPETFQEVRDTSEQLVSAGVCDYGITFANYSWFVEQWFAQEGQQLVDNDNGRSGAPEHAFLDSDMSHALFEWWTEMEDDGLLLNSGIKGRGKAKKAFNDGQAGMLIASTSSLGSIETATNFDFGTAYLPVLSERNGVLVGGASLWISGDLDSAEESVVGDFLAWLLEPEQQARWHRETGYFPVTEGAVTELQRDDWFEQNPHYATAFDQFSETTDMPATNGAQIGPFPTVRSLIETAREKMTDDRSPSISDGLTRLNNEVEAELFDWNTSENK